MPLNREEFQERLSETQERFILEALTGGLADYSNPDFYRPAALRDHNSTAKATNRHSHIVGRAIRDLPNHSDVRLVTLGERKLFILGNFARLVFKRLTKDLRPRNNPTAQSEAFLDQLTIPVQLSFDLLPMLTNVVAGYRINEFSGEAAFYIVCPNKRHNCWDLRLNGPDEPKQTDLFASLAQPPTGGAPGLRRVRARRDAERQEKSDATNR